MVKLPEGIDINNLIILGKTQDCLNLDPIDKKIEGLGIDCQKINGHSISEITKSLDLIEKNNNLSCILAQTIKGKGSSIMENQKNWHYWNPMTDEQIKKTREELE